MKPSYPLRRWLTWQIWGRSLPRETRRPRRCKPARDYRYRAWIRSLPSCVSGQPGCEAAHTGSDGGMSQKASDTSCVPLTPAEHREYHRIGRAGFEQKHSLNLQALTKRLYRDWILYSRETK